MARSVPMPVDAAEDGGTYIPTPREVASSLFSVQIYSMLEDRTGALFALLHILDVSAADVARMTGLTRGRIHHYESGHGTVPESREIQMRALLRGVLDGCEEFLQAVAEDGGGYPEGVQHEAVPVMKAKIAACKKILRKKIG